MTTVNDSPVILVLGGTGGIGRAVCSQLAGKGVRVVAAARTTPPPGSERSAVVSFRTVDATSVDAVQDCVRSVVEEQGRLDGVVNCVGSILLKPAHGTSAAQWHDVIATNLTSAFATVRAAAPALRKHGGSIVLMGSAAGQFGLPNHEAIAAAKAGVVGLARAAAATYAAAGVRVNVVAPGLVDTPLAAPLLQTDQARERSAGMHPLGRIGTPNDVASAIVWLLDEAQGWVTGQVLGVDGGLAAVRSKHA